MSTDRAASGQAAIFSEKGRARIAAAAVPARPIAVKSASETL